MKHIMQITAMASDILIIGFALLLIYGRIKTGSDVLWIVSIVLLLGAYSTWKKQGGFIAWTKEGRANFYEGWDKITKGE